MIIHLATLLAFQLLGEVTSRGLDLPLPGPVIGMALLFISCVMWPRLAQTITPTTTVLLGHLSLLFVPAGVGVVGHLDKFGSDGAALGVAIIGSTVVAISIGALTFVGLCKLMATSHD
ncbi:MAG: CidA/LrgA family protein [Yoonia sp.]|nr:CidA/LrgA family protein [Yoonia sp.]